MKSNYMSYSMIVDKNYNTNIKERNIHYWVKNDTVTHCYNCKKKFWFYLRKHHCRSCGRIFCCYCTEKTYKLPKDLEKFPIEPNNWINSINNIILWKDTVKQRVCDKCYNRLYKINKVKNIINVFLILCSDLKDLYIYMQVCSDWNYASSYILSNFREIQYKLNYQKFSNNEKKLLWINRYYLIGHSKWIAQLIKITNYKDDKYINELVKILKIKDTKINCFYTMCSRSCSNKLLIEDVLDLLKLNITNDFIKKYIANHFINISNEEFICYIPYLLFYLENNENLIGIIFNKCVDDYKIRLNIYWMLQYYISIYKCNFLSNIFKCLVELIKNKINENELDKLDSIILLSKNIKHDNIFNPFYPNQKYKGIEKSYIKNSLSNPIILPLYYIKNNDKVYNSIMVKNENLLKDKIIVNIISLIDIILKKEEKLDLCIVKYDIIPINKHIGLIEIIDNSTTIYDILEKLKISIQNYIIEHNKNKTILEVRNKFIKSSAAYCVISYILGFGDRHLDNIMITNDGRLFHIDFGYILGYDPKYSTQNIRITSDIIDAMGGQQSSDYKYFQKLCTKIYNCLRRYINLFMNLLLLIPKFDNNISEEIIKQEIIKKFEPGENKIEAKLHLVNKMNNSHDTLEYKVIDFFHKSYKENYIKSGFNYLVNKIY